MSFWRSTQVRARGPAKRAWLLTRGEGEAPDDARAFVDCILAGREAEVTARDGAHAVETLMAAYVSAARGEAVCLHDIAWPLDRTVSTAG